MPLSADARLRRQRLARDVVGDRRNDDEPRVRTLLREVEQTYIEPLVHYAFPVTVLPPATELEAVCTIFETLNRTGKPLTPFELISARAFAGGHSLHDYWDAARSGVSDPRATSASSRTTCSKSSRCGWAARASEALCSAPCG